MKNIVTLAFLLQFMTCVALAQQARYVGSAPVWWRNLVDAPAPQYSFEALRSHQRGRGIYRLTIRPDGHVDKVKVLQTSRSVTIDEIAIDTLKRWTFKPGSVTSVELPITFLVGEGSKHAVFVGR